MSLLDSWTRGEHTADLLDDRGSVTHPTYRKGSGPGVIVIAEIPGMTPDVIGFAEEVVTAGFTVVMPHLFGDPGRPLGIPYVAGMFPKLCVSKEFNTMRVGQTSPVAGWLRSLARELHAELGGPGVGALGMCFTGGFALAMTVDDSVAAPVLCQPSLPFPVGRKRAADLNLSPSDLTAVKARGCEVLGLHYTKDPATGTRFDTLDRELGDRFIRVDFAGKGHSVVTLHRQQEAVDRILTFFADKLQIRGDTSLRPSS